MFVTRGSVYVSPISTPLVRLKKAAIKDHDLHARFSYLFFKVHTINPTRFREIYLDFAYVRGIVSHKQPLKRVRNLSSILQIPLVVDSQCSDSLYQPWFTLAPQRPRVVMVVNPYTNMVYYFNFNRVNRVCFKVQSLNLHELSPTNKRPYVMRHDLDLRYVHFLRLQAKAPPATSFAAQDYSFSNLKVPTLALRKKNPLFVRDLSVTIHFLASLLGKVPTRRISPLASKHLRVHRLYTRHYDKTKKFLAHEYRAFW